MEVGRGNVKSPPTGFFFSIKTICPDTHTHKETNTGKRQRHKINYNGNAIKKESGERESKGKEAKNWIDAQLPIQDYPLFLFFVYVFFFHLRDGATLNNQKRKRKRMQIIREIRR